MQVLIKVCLYQSPYTVFYISEDNFVLPDEKIYTAIGVKKENRCDVSEYTNEKSKLKGLKITANALFLQPFVRECVNSRVYRTNVVMNLCEVTGCTNTGTLICKMILEPPDKEIIDYSWNDKVLRLIWTRVEIENAFSWLSTLGGAYSALGDYFEHCAEEAGRISIRQYKLSRMLGDHALAARSRLYSALSYAQKGDLRLSRHIVRKIAEFAGKTHDTRLIRMCQGVWAKLKYLRSLAKSQEKKCGNGNGKVIVKS